MPARPRQKQNSRVRGISIDLLCEWSNGERYASDLLDFAAREFDLITPDAAMLREIVLSTLRNLTLIDHWIDDFTGSRHLDHRTRWALRIGLCQIVLIGISEHAAVNETVAAAGRARGFVNAILRRGCREKDALKEAAAALPIETRLSHPKWLVNRWRAHFGEEKTAALCEWNQQHAPMNARINRLHPEAAAQTDDFILCEELPRDDLSAGKVYIQDPSTILAPRLLAPRAGQRVLDACAAPGGKTAFMAQLMGNQGEIIACDVSAARLRRLASNLKRLHVTNAHIEQHDWAAEELPEWTQGGFDAVLLDVPCSNTGVMRRRIDVRWRLTETSFAEQNIAQERLLRGAARAVKPGGVLVYSTCSIDPEENGLLVRRVLETLPGFTLEKEESSFPTESGMDGAYAARLVKAA